MFLLAFGLVLRAISVVSKWISFARNKIYPHLKHLPVSDGDISVWTYGVRVMPNAYLTDKWQYRAAEKSCVIPEWGLCYIKCQVPWLCFLRTEDHEVQNIIYRAPSCTRKCFLCLSFLVQEDISVIASWTEWATHGVARTKITEFPSPSPSPFPFPSLNTIQFSPKNPVPHTQTRNHFLRPRTSSWLCSK